jgi:hypothetical protein
MAQTDTSPQQTAQHTQQTSGYPPPATSDAGRGWTVGAFVCAAIAVVFVPIVIGPIGVGLGYMGQRRGDPVGKWAMVAAVAGAIIGILLNIAIMSARS